MSNRSFKMPLRIFISILLILLLKLNISLTEVSIELPFYKFCHKTVCGWFMPLNVFSKYLSHQVLLCCHRSSLRLTTVDYVLLFREKDLKSSLVMSSSEYMICRMCSGIIFFFLKEKTWSYALNTNPRSEIYYL